MRASVMAAFTKFNTPLEGMLNYMYTDAKGLVTTGMGNLIDPVAAALILPWKHLDGSDASQDEVQNEWQTVKSAWPGVQSAATRSLTTLHLEQSSIDNLVVMKAHQFEDQMRAKLTNYDNAPADAQMGALSMAWAMGGGFVNSFPHFVAAFNADDYVTAGQQANFQGVGIQPRLSANQLLFRNAAAVVQGGGDRDVLWWPQSVSAGDVAAAPSGGSRGLVALEIAAGLVALGGAAYAAWRLFK